MNTGVIVVMFAAVTEPYLYRNASIGVARANMSPVSGITTNRSIRSDWSTRARNRSLSPRAMA